MMSQYQRLVESEKAIAGDPYWSKPKGVDLRMTLVASLMLEGRVLQGLELVGRTHLDPREADVSFSLIYLPTDSRRDAVQLARIDWRPKTPHGNDHPRTPAELLGDIEGSHHHSFPLNWSSSAGKPLRNLPIAEEIIPDYQSVEELLDGVGKLFRISGAGSSLPRPWPKDLFS
ncbi:hypothetical protein WBP07_18100 [Novosphingobium sp. BL-8A]|uniref:hypothetical protein n=1 Tax=Novosphingobium sp. BL-8A TaxID=3127639 RepID=UPI00375722F4